MSRLPILAAVVSLLAALTQAASATDMPMKAAPRIVIPYNWTGIYVGGHLSGGWGTSDTVLEAIPSVGVPAGTPQSSIRPNGFLGGGQIGFNWQMNWAVVGVEGSYSAADLLETVSCSVAGSPFSCPTKVDWLATVTGRVGAVVNERLLAYVKGGAA